MGKFLKQVVLLRGQLSSVQLWASEGEVNRDLQILQSRPNGPIPTIHPSIRFPLFLFLSSISPSLLSSLPNYYARPRQWTRDLESCTCYGEFYGRLREFLMTCHEPQLKPPSLQAERGPRILPRNGCILSERRKVYARKGGTSETVFYEGNPFRSPSSLGILRDS